MEVDKNSKKYLFSTIEEMRRERQSFIDHWKELSRYINPRRGRFLTTDRNKGDKVMQEILNSAGGQAHKVCANGMVSGIMSPSRPWFDLGLDDEDLMEYQPVKIWLAQTGEQINRVFNQSNFYNMVPVMFGELTQFGTGCMLHEDDFENVARFYTQTVGSYMIAQDSDYRVNKFAREFEMTVSQLVGKFGLANVSTQVKRLYDTGSYETWIPVYHLIEPNPSYAPAKAGAQFKKFRSIYFEVDSRKDNSEMQFLRRSGYKQFPAYVPRWAVTGEDIYGTDCPGMTALGDIKMLQVQEREMAKAIAKQNTPPLQGPASLANKQIDNLPGGSTLFDADANNTLKAIYEVRPQVQAMAADIQRTERRIGQAFFTDIFNAISTMEGIQPRNQLEITARNQERLLQLGPVLERSQGEFLTPAVDRVFDQLVEASTDARGNWLDRSALPPPPPELQGRQVRPRYISSIAIAQRAAGSGPLERLLTFAGGLLQAGIVRDMNKIDGDQAIDEYARQVGAPPKVVVPDDQVSEARKAAQQQQQLAQNAEVAATGAKAFKDVAQGQAVQGSRNTQ
jgi:hypothetical protein